MPEPTDQATIPIAMTTPSAIRRTAVWTLAMGLLIAAAGCARNPLRPDDQRTPFDRYHQARNTQPEPFLEDEFGRRRPNLRARLLRDEE